MDTRLQRILDLLDQEANYSKERSAQVGKIVINADPSTGGGAQSRDKPLFLPTGIDAFRIAVSNTLSPASLGSINVSYGQGLSPGSPDFETLGEADCRVFKLRQAGVNFWWNAQVGVTITIFYYVGIQPDLGTLGVRLLNNSVVVVGGSNATAEIGSILLPVSAIPVIGTTLLLDTDVTRKSGTLQVNGGDIIISPLAPAGVSGAPTVGIEILDGTSFAWENTFQLLAIPTSGAPVVTGISEF